MNDDASNVWGVLSHDDFGDQRVRRSCGERLRFRRGSGTLEIEVNTVRVVQHRRTKRSHPVEHNYYPRQRAFGVLLDAQ
ncbi:MAG TPA: hypothetical protein VFI82_15445 [Terriglobales bacterium]|nr:hypothetical protein [Terriglobales bacterium]